MKALRCLAMTLLLAGACAAQPHSWQELQRQADEAGDKQCAQLSMQVALHSLADADRLFSAGDTGPAHSAIDISIHYVRRSVDCTLQSRKHEKAAEIELRSFIRRVNDVARKLDWEERASLDNSLAELDEQRNRLLQGIFGSAAANPPEKQKP